MNDTPAAAESKPSRRLGRSPAYPSFPVQKALQQIEALYAQEKEYAAPFASALKAWGYGAKSSGGRQTLATMKYYGLIDIAGEGDARRIKVSESALKILRDPREDDTEKRQMIRRVALTPAAHKLLLEEYPDGLASDGTVQYFLIEQGFNEQAARELLAEYKDTASFVGLYEPQSGVDKSPSEAQDSSDDEPPVLKVGDRVQWTSQGVDQFNGGGIILGFSDDGEWVFTDKGSSGVPAKEVTLMQSAAQQEAKTPPTIPAHLLALGSSLHEEKLREGWQEERLLDDNGGEIFIRYEGEASSERYEFIRDYLDFKLSRLKPKR